MSSAGHVLDMMKRWAANRELLKAKHTRHAKIKSLYQQAVCDNHSSNPLDHLSPEELAKARKKVMKKLRVQQKQSLIKLFVIGAVLLGLAVYLMSIVFEK